ncbi:MAG TPA: hypothetical protein VHV58_06730, partial [Pseudolabrys sp.]|nr:hypothetical protein [Pseudolabrys sp.]
MTIYTGPYPATISGSTYTEVDVFSTSFTGNLVNSGTLAGSTAGEIRVIDSSINGAISNSGTISAATFRVGIYIDDSSINAIINTAAISVATGTAIQFSSSARFGSTSAAGEISNSGVITASAGKGISAANIRIFDGNIGNSGTINTSGSHVIGDGIELQAIQTFSGTIINSAGGTITPGGGTGVDLAAHFVTGDITNAGVISNAGTGIKLDVGTFTGNITNTGTIAAGVGIEVLHAQAFDGNIINAAGATLRGGVGIAVGSRFGPANGATSFNGDIVNFGTISASATGGLLVANSTVAGTISNAGHIVGNGFAVVDGGKVSSIINGAGATITQRTSVYSAAFLVWGGSAGSITNAGTIMGGIQGVFINSGSVGTIVNSGTLDAATGMRFEAATVAGGITNTGTISASETAIFVSSGSIGGVIVNSGTIEVSFDPATAIRLLEATGPDTIDQAAGTIIGAIDFSSYGDLLDITGGVISGDITGQGNGTVEIALGAGGTLLYGNEISGVGAVDLTAGTLELTTGGSIAGALTFD